MPDSLIINESPAHPSVSTEVSSVKSAFENKRFAAPALDLIAIHAAADNEVNEIYRLNANISGGLMVLLQLAKGICNDPDDLEKLRFVIDALRDINDDLIDANDRLTNAIDPLNPTVLDE